MKSPTAVRLLALALWLAGLAPSAVHSQDAAPTTAALEAPDPGALSADWWAYLADAGPALDARARALQERLDDLLATLTRVGEPHDTIRSLATEIDGIINEYVANASRSPAPPPVRTPALEQYLIQDYLELVARRREQSFELELITDETARKRDALARADKAVDNLMAGYLSLSASDPGRQLEGLRVMRARMTWATGMQRLGLLETREKRLSASVGHLGDLVAEAATRLTATAQSIARWRDKQSAAREDLQRLRDEASALRLADGAFSVDEPGAALERRQAQELRDYEVRLALAELRLHQATLAVRLGEYLVQPDDTAAESLRAARQELEESLAPLGPRLRRYRQATERERSTAQRLIAETEDANAVLRATVERADATTQSLNRATSELAVSEALLAVSRDVLLKTQGTFEDFAARAASLARNAVDDMWSLGSASLFTINETPVTALGLVRFTLILLVAWWLSLLVRRGLSRLMRRRDTMNPASVYTLNRLFHYVILTIGFLVAMSSIGIDFTKFALIASAFGVGLGFGLQAIFSNFVAGLIILFERSLKVGDFVELESGVTGEVREINIRSTLVTTNDNIDMLLPNSEFVNGRVINWTLREAYRRLRVPFGVAYGSDKDRVRQAGLEAAANVRFTLTNVPGREPQVWLVGFGESSLDFELVVWLTPDAVKRPAAVNATYCWELESALGRHGIEIPFPQRDLHLRTWPRRGGHDADDEPVAAPPGAP